MSQQDYLLKFLKIVWLLTIFWHPHMMGNNLFDRAVEYVMHFLPAHFTALRDLQHTVKPPSCHSLKKSKIIPMTLLQRDEKYTDNTIKILHDFKSDCNLTGTHQVHVVS